MFVIFQNDPLVIVSMHDFKNCYGGCNFLVIPIETLNCDAKSEVVEIKYRLDVKIQTKYKLLLVNSYTSLTQNCLSRLKNGTNNASFNFNHCFQKFLLITNTFNTHSFFVRNYRIISAITIFLKNRLIRVLKKS